MATTTQQLRAVIELANIIEEAALAGGAIGAPSGVVYAALMPIMSLDQYQQMIGAMERAGRITVSGHCIRLTDQAKADRAGATGGGD